MLPSCIIFLQGFNANTLTDYQYTQYPMAQHFSASPRQNSKTKVHMTKSYIWNYSYKVAVQKGVGNLCLIFVPFTYHTCTNHQLPLKHCTYIMKTWRINYIYIYIYIHIYHGSTKFSLEQTTNTQRGYRCIALLFL